MLFNPLGLQSSRQSVAGKPVCSLRGRLTGLALAAALAAPVVLAIPGHVRADQPAGAQAGAAAARQELVAGDAALGNNNPIEARKHFEAAVQNEFADPETRKAGNAGLAKSEDVLKQTAAGQKSLYDQAVSDYDNGRLDQAKTAFESLVAVTYKPPLFHSSPENYLQRITTRQAAPPLAVDKHQAEASYDQGVAEYRKGDYNNAKIDLQKAVDLGFKPGFMQKSPQDILSRMNADEQKWMADEAYKRSQEAYNRGKEEYARGDMITARADFVAARNGGYKPGWGGGDAPDAYLKKIDAQQGLGAAPARTVMPAVAEAPPAQPSAQSTASQSTANAAQGSSNAAQGSSNAAQGSSNASQGQRAPTAASALADRATTDKLALRQRSDMSRAKVDLAKQAEVEGRKQQALELYTQAVDLDSGNLEALAGRDRLQEQLGLIEPGKAATPLNEEQRSIREQVQAIYFRFNADIADARTATQSRDWAGAKRALDNARIARNTDPGLFNIEQLRQMDAVLAQTNIDLEQAKADWEQQKFLEGQKRAFVEEEERLKEIKKQRENTIAGLVKLARQDMDEKNWTAAMGVLDQIVALDPKNDFANGVRQFVEDRTILKEERTYREKYDLEFEKQLNVTEENKIPYLDILRYPKDWPDISERRDEEVRSERGVSRSEQAVQAQLDKRLPEIKFDQVGFSDVIDFLRDITGANIFVNWRTLEAGGVTNSAPITARLRDVPFSKALSIILDEAGGANTKLGYTIDEGVITISTAEDLAKNVATRVYDIRDLIVDVPDFTDAPEFSLQALSQTANGAGGGGGGGGQGGGLFGGGAGGGQAGKEGETRQQLVDQIVKLIEETVAPDSWRDNGGSVGSIRELSGQLIVTQTPENQRALVKLLEQLRETRAIEVTVETRFLSVDRHFMEDVGLDIGAIFNPAAGFNGLSPVNFGATPNPTNNAQALNALASTVQLGGGPGGRPLTAYDLLPPLQGGGGVGEPSNFAGARFGGHGAGFPINNPAGRGIVGTYGYHWSTVPVSVTGDQFTALPATGVPGTLGTSATPPQGLNVGPVSYTFLDDFQVNFLIRATQASQLNTLLTAPRLTLFNGQRAYVLVAHQQAYVSNLTPVVGAGAASFAPTIGILNSGVVLDVQATVSADRKYVTLTLRPELATNPHLDAFVFQVAGETNVLGANGVGGGFATGNGGNVTGIIQEPSLDIVEVRTTVSVPDGGTLLLGGETIAGEIQDEVGVPILSKIPFLKRLFTNKSTAKDEHILLILVKPTIIIEREIENKTFPLLSTKTNG